MLNFNHFKTKLVIFCEKEKQNYKELFFMSRVLNYSSLKRLLEYCVGFTKAQNLQKIIMNHGDRNLHKNYAFFLTIK